MRKTFIYLVLMLFASQAIAQQYDSILNKIEENSSLLSALKQQMEAQKLANRTGIFLSNPEIEFYYLWGDPTGLGTGNRTDIAISQSFDFPSAYIYKGQVADLENLNIELKYRSERINLLLMAKEICINLTYYNALAEECALRLTNAELIAKPFQNMSNEVGSRTLLEANKALLNLTEMQNNIAQINIEQDRLHSELKRLNGGIDIIFDESSFPHTTLPPSFEAWYTKSESKNLVLQYVRRQVEIKEKKVSLNRAMTLPKLSAGYVGEFATTNERFQGVMIGISIPLWENKNLIRQAKAEVKASKIVAEDTRMQFYINLQNLFLKASTLQKSVISYSNSINNHDNSKLLKIALDSGEISLLHYLLEMQLYFQTIENLLVLERDLELAIAQLSAVEL